MTSLAHRGLGMVPKLGIGQRRRQPAPNASFCFSNNRGSGKSNLNRKYFSRQQRLK
jgi:hypothetical protein